MVPVMGLLPLGPGPVFPFFEALLERIVQCYQGCYRFRRVCRIRYGRLLRRFRRARHRYRLRQTLGARGHACRGCPRRCCGRGRGRRGGGRGGSDRHRGC